MNLVFPLDDCSSLMSISTANSTVNGTSQEKVEYGTGPGDAQYGSITFKGKRGQAITFRNSAYQPNPVHDITVMLSVFPKSNKESVLLDYGPDSFAITLDGRNVKVEIPKEKKSVMPGDRLTSMSKLKLNKWNFVAVTYTYSSGQTKIYIDGSEDKMGTISKRPLPTSGAMRLGPSASKRGKQVFEGMLFCVQVYDSVKTELMITNGKDCPICEYLFNKVYQFHFI